MSPISTFVLNTRFFFLVDVARNAFNVSLHGDCNNLIKVFHHDINIHKTFFFHFSRLIMTSYSNSLNCFRSKYVFLSS